MEISIQTELKFETCICPNCAIIFALPSKFLYESKADHRTIYCPSGHLFWFPGKSEAEKLRDELKRKEQELANKVIENLNIQKQFTRLKKGTCPCCKRSFQNLKNHIKNQHPELLKK